MVWPNLRKKINSKVDSSWSLRGAQCYSRKTLFGLIALLVMIVCSIMWQTPTPEAVGNTSTDLKSIGADEWYEGNWFNSSKPIIYSASRADRSGSAIQDMLMAHAWAFEDHSHYGGACSGGGGKRAKWQGSSQDLIEKLGLERIIHFECPKGLQTKPWWQGWGWGKERNFNVLSNKVYRSKDTAIFTPEWSNYIRQRLNHAAPLSLDRNESSSSRDTVVVAMHIRRGDVRVNTHPARYLPNSHYQRVLRHFVLPNKALWLPPGQSKPKTLLIKIHSETRSTEPWNDTAAYWMGQDVDSDPTNVTEPQPPVQIQLCLDYPLSKAWHDLATADVVVLSRSSFSYVPALLNFRAQKIIYTQFWHAPQSHWIWVTEDMMNQTEQDSEKLRAAASWL